MEFLWLFFEISGTIAFAISGALVGIARRMDIFGVFVLALCTAIGGGVVRDILVGSIPPNSFQTALYITLATSVVCVLFVMYRKEEWRDSITQRFKLIYQIADTMGLASFTVSGTTIGYSLYPSLGLFCILLGLITAIGGGILRDVLARRIPSVLREEVYALPSLVGGCVYYDLAVLGHVYAASYTAFILVCIIRYLAIRYQWSLPKMIKK